MESLIRSNKELYYSLPSRINSNLIVLNKEESKHIVGVMRHHKDDEIYITNGLGKIFLCKIEDIKKEIVLANILKEYFLPAKYPKLTVCVPMLRNHDRLEFALEKATELGITKFILFHAVRSVPKKINKDRIEKILITTIKQSLQSWLPEVKCADSIDEIALMEGRKIVFDQCSKIMFSADKINLDDDSYLIFGPEGGLTKSEIEKLNTSFIFSLADNRLRTETAIIKAIASLKIL